MKQVERFIVGLSKVVSRAKSGYYLNLGSIKGDVYAFMGGEVLFWVKNALKAKNLPLAMRLFLDGLPMIIAATARRANVTIRGRCPPQILPPLRSRLADAGGGA